MRRILMLAIAIFVVHTTYAQIPYNDSRELLLKGVELYKKGEYKNAIAQYMQVHECDTNYSIAVYETVLALQADSAYEDAKKLAIEGLKTRKADTRSFLLALASNYDYLKNHDSALALYDSLIKLYPYDNQPWYEKGIVYYRQGLYDAALYNFQKSLMLRPMHFNSHYMLAIVYGMQGRLTESLIAFEGSLLVTQLESQGKESVAVLNSIAQETDEVVKLYRAKKEEYSHPLFDDIDQLINSKIALDSKYKLNIQIDNSVFRQSQMVMEKLKYDPSDTNFVMQYYVPMLVDLYSKDMFEGFMLVDFSEFGYDDINALAKKKTSSVAEAKELIFPYLKNIQQTRELNYAKRKNAPEKYHYNYTEEDLIAVGVAKQIGKDKYITGDVVQYYNNHNIANKGRYDDLGKIDGWWTSYFSTGGLKYREFYTHGQIIDSAFYYHDNGRLRKVIVRNKAGDVKAQLEYDISGWLSIVKLKPSEKVYEEKIYYENGVMKSDFMYIEDKFKDGSYRVFHKNGKIKEQFTASNGKALGAYNYYYDNGNPEEESSYAKGNLDGVVKIYYESGKLKEKKTYEDGVIEGPYEEYYEDGAISEKGTYHKSTKVEKEEYAPGGRMYSSISLNDNGPVHLKYTDADNVVVYEKTDKKGVREYPLYFYNDNKAADIKIDEDGKRDGTLTYYSSAGIKNQEAVYKHGNLDGIQKTFYADGKLASEQNYTDDVRDGYYKAYYNNGTVSLEGWFKKDKRQGLWKAYNLNGKMKTEYYFLNGEYDGYYKEYNPNGVPTDKYIFDKGVSMAHVCYDTGGKLTDSVGFDAGTVHVKVSHRQGTPKVYDLEYGLKYSSSNGYASSTYMNGVKKSEYYYKEGNKDSLSLSYYPNGQITERGTYENGNRIGKWLVYNELGDLVFEKNYRNGNLHGSFKTYTNKTLRVDYTMADGYRDGKQTYYGEDGKVAFVLVYEGPSLAAYTYEGKDGKLLPAIRIKKGTPVITYYSNGQKSGEVGVAQNLLHGPMKIYFSNGKLAEERMYTYGDIDGVNKCYSPDGKLVYELTYKDDEANGTEHTYNTNGEEEITGNYYNGQYHGPLVIKDRQTQKKTTYNYTYGELSSVNQ